MRRQGARLVSNRVRGWCEVRKSGERFVVDA